jgi:hypothetical protein
MSIPHIPLAVPGRITLTDAQFDRVENFPPAFPARHRTPGAV